VAAESGQRAAGGGQHEQHEQGKMGLAALTTVRERWRGGTIDSVVGSHSAVREGEEESHC
jgi:hypothetical protein